MISIDSEKYKSVADRRYISKDWIAPGHLASVLKCSKALVTETAKGLGFCEWGMREGDKDPDYWIAPETVENLRYTVIAIQALKVRNNHVFFNQKLIDKLVADEAWNELRSAMVLDNRRQVPEAEATVSVFETASTIPAQNSEPQIAEPVHTHKRGRMTKELSDQLDGTIMTKSLMNVLGQMSVKDIADMYGVSEVTVVRHREKLSMYLQGYSRGLMAASNGF